MDDLARPVAEDRAERRGSAAGDRGEEVSADLTPEQRDVVERTRAAMVAVNSPLIRRSGRKKGDRGTCKKCGLDGHYAKTCGRQPPPKSAPIEKPRQVKRHRVDGHNHCSVCGELGHSAKRHTSTARSVLAVKALLDERLTLEQASARFGISRQVVQQELRRRAGDVQTPTQERWHIARLRAVTLAVAGQTKQEICASAGISINTVERALRERGIRARNPWLLSEDDIAAAANAVANGASYAEAAADLGRASQRLADRLRASGVYSSATSRGRTDGRIKRAIARVEAGESVQDACRAERCATVAVYKHFKRLREVVK